MTVPPPQRDDELWSAYRRAHTGDIAAGYYAAASDTGLVVLRRDSSGGLQHVMVRPITHSAGSRDEVQVEPAGRLTVIRASATERRVRAAAEVEEDLPALFQRAFPAASATLGPLPLSGTECFALRTGDDPALAVVEMARAGDGFVTFVPVSLRATARMGSTADVDGASTGPAVVRRCPTCARSYSRGERFCEIDGQLLLVGAIPGDLLGTVVAGKFRIDAVIGSGGMSRVYRAWHELMGRDCALKFLRPELLSDEGLRQRFLREASSAGRIHHPNVATVYDCGFDDSRQPYIAMELVEGESLADILKAGGPLPPSAVAEIVLQVAHGLDAAHALQVVHRDIKPENILVAGPLSHPRVKVVDFGIAKRLDDAAEAGTVPGMIFGTPDYMSPEQVFGTTITNATDVFSLAVVAFVSLTGKRAWDGETSTERMMKRTAESPRRISEVDPSLPNGTALVAVFDKALSRAPDKRHPSATAFARALSDALLSAPQVIVQPAVVERDASVAGAGDTTPQGESARIDHSDTSTSGRQSVAPLPPPGRSRWMVYGGVAVTLVAVVSAIVWRSADRAGATREGERQPAIAQPAETLRTDERAAVPTNDSARSVELAKGSGTTGRDSAPRQDGRGSAKVSGTIAGSDRSRETRPGDTRPASTALSAADVRRELNDIRALTNPATLSANDAVRARSAIGNLLPRLTLAADSAEAEKMHADVLLKQQRVGEACALLLRIERRGAARAAERAEMEVLLRLCR